MNDAEEILEHWLFGDFHLPLPESVASILREELFGEDDKRANFQSPSDQDDFLESHVDVAAYVVHVNSRKPWVPQSDVIRKFDLPPEVLKEVNRRIRASKLLQKAVVKLGKAKKYWETIVPFANRLSDVFDHQYRFPLRLAFYPGVSCMFYCGFCGRNQSAKYPTGQVKAGFDMFAGILSSMPAEAAISISGGLEPLTNPRLGDIVTHAKNHGIRVPLITNGYSLTKNYLLKNPGLWNLDSLRVSLYGVDTDSYFYITRLKKAFKMVLENSINFLQQRNLINPKLKFGFNFIVVDDNIDQLEGVINLIHRINKQVTNGPGVDFLTIRDDFESVVGEEFDHERVYRLNGELSQKREKLIDALPQLETLRETLCPNLYIDYGYALYPYSKGYVGDQLLKTPEGEMRKSAYPQLSLAVDLFGDVFLYREAGFLNRKGNEKFVIGRVNEEQSFEQIVKEFVSSKREIDNQPGDTRFMDAFDHILTAILNRFEADIETGFSLSSHPVSAISQYTDINLGNNWYRDQK